MKPTPADVKPLVVLAFLGALTALALVLMAEGVARGLTEAHWMPGAQLLAAGGLLRALTSLATRSYAARAAIGAKEALRAELADRVLADGGGRASTAVLGSLGLDELDAYYRTVLPAIATTATIPLLVGARILSVDWVSALIIVLTVPLVPVFMALVGLHTKQRADAASATLQRLSDHLAELARGLPVLVGLGRVEQQSAALHRISAEHRSTTMTTLRSAFLSSLVLELIATIAVAIVAVFVGIRLMNGDLSLAVGLVALVLAPECFAPFRELGAAFHASQDGLGARRRVRALVDAPMVEPAETGVVSLRRARVRTVGPISFSLRPNSITALDGPSGIGKSTVLEVLAGLLPLETGTVVTATSIAYVPQHPHTVGETVAAELAYYGDAGDVLTRLGLAGLENVDPARLSPGELRRLAVARALLRVEAGAGLLLLDEPTAHLDAASALLVENEIAALRGRVTIVIASHEAGVAALADYRVTLGRSTRREASAVVEPAPVVELVETSRARISTGSITAGSITGFLRPALWRFAAAALIGTLAALFAITLTGVSAWLIVRASETPEIMYLLVAIVGVRFFGLGRASLRYAERLLTHDAVLAATTELRMRLWAGLAAHGLASRALARGGVALDYLVAAADSVRDLVPRVVLPPVVAVLTATAVTIGVGALAPTSVPTLLPLLVVALVIAPLVALIADRRAAQAQTELRSTVLRRFAALVGAAAELRANGVGDRVRDEITALDAAAGTRGRRTTAALGLGSALVIATAALTSAAMLATDAPTAILAVLVLLPIALVDPLLAHSESVQQWPALRAALAKVSALDVPAREIGGEPVPGILALELRDVGVDGVFADVSAKASPGDWLVVEGPSGSGKSTLLEVLLGYRPATAGTVFVNGVDASTLDQRELRANIAWCPQDAHIFDSTVRGNLLLARPASDIELVDMLHRVGLNLDLDLKTGAEGSHLSGGQRQRLAVARTLLLDTDVVLLDEPTAHLDGEAAELVMHDLRRALGDRIVVLVTHHAAEARGSDIHVPLGAVPAFS